MNELIERAEKSCRINTTTDEAQDDELLTLTGEDDLPYVVAHSHVCNTHIC